jgi:translocation and assembly module TamA
MPRCRPSCHRLAVILAIVLTGASSPSLAADPVSYTVTMASTGNAGLDAALAGSSQLLSLRATAPAGPFALVARARLDVARLQTALDSYGYYQGRPEIRIAGHALNDTGLPDWLSAQPQSAQIPVAVGIDTGPLYHLRHVTLDGAVPAADAHDFTLSPGAPAIAANVLGAAASLQSALREDGYALARVDPPVATEIPSEHALDVSFHVTTGPRVNLGPITIKGLVRVHQSYVRRRLLLRQGQRYQTSRIDAAREDLASIGVFAGVKISAATRLDAAGQIPLLVDVSERKRHSVTFNIAYSTDLGASAGATWSHRNLFGNAEQLNLTASIDGLGGTADKGIGYLAKAQFLKPDFYHRDQMFEFDIEAIQQDLDTYNQTALIAGPSLNRLLSKEWTVSIGLTGTQESILQEGVRRDYTLAALPLTAHFDSTHVKSLLDDPTHGIRATAIVTPTESLSGRNATFLILQEQVSTYFDLNRLGIAPPGRSVLALRGLVGSAQGATDFQLPPDQRFYGGGSATVRGYRYQSIGPQFPDGVAIGGAAIDSATIELRQRLWKSIGAAVFADAGQVNTSSAPFEGRLEIGAGVGVRYYTPIGPIRVDIAVPVNPQPHGDTLELYLGLGQAF